MDIKLKQNEVLTITTGSGGNVIVPENDTNETKVLATTDQISDYSNDIEERLDNIEGRIEDLSNDLYSAIDDLSNDKADDDNVIHKTGPLVDMQTIRSDLPDPSTATTDFYETKYPFRAEAENGTAVIEFDQTSQHSSNSHFASSAIWLYPYPETFDSETGEADPEWAGISLYCWKENHTYQGRDVAVVEAGIDYYDGSGNNYHLTFPTEAGTLVVTGHPDAPASLRPADYSHIGITKLSDSYWSDLDAANGETASTPLATKKVGKITDVQLGPQMGYLPTEQFSADNKIYNPYSSEDMYLNREFDFFDDELATLLAWFNDGVADEYKLSASDFSGGGQILRHFYLEWGESTASTPFFYKIALASPSIEDPNAIHKDVLKLRRTNGAPSVGEGNTWENAMWSSAEDLTGGALPSRLTDTSFVAVYTFVFGFKTEALSEQLEKAPVPSHLWEGTIMGYVPTLNYANFLNATKSDKNHTHPSLVSANGNVSLTLENDGTATISDGSSSETIATMDDLDDLSNDIHSLLDDFSNDRIVSENGVTTVKAQDDGIATVTAPAPAYAVTFNEGFRLTDYGGVNTVYEAPAGGETITFVGPYPLNGSSIPSYNAVAERGARYFYAPDTCQIVDGLPVISDSTFIIVSDWPYRTNGVPLASLTYFYNSRYYTAGNINNYGGGNVVLALDTYYATGTASIAEVSSETVSKISTEGHTHESIEVSYAMSNVRRHADIVLTYDNSTQMTDHPMFRSYEISGSTYSKRRREYLAFSSDIPAAGSITPAMDSGNGDRGASNSYSREDHVHPADRTRATVSDLANHEHRQILSADGNSSLKVGNDGVPYTPTGKQEQMTVVASMSFVNPSNSGIHGTITLLSNDASSYSIDEWNNGISKSFQPPEEYDGTSAYAVGTTVRYNNVGYVCIVPTFAGIAPTNSLYWNKLPTPVSIEASVTLYLGPSPVIADERCTINLYGGSGSYCDYRVRSSSGYIDGSGMEFDGANIWWFSVKTQPDTDPTEVTFLQCVQSTDISYRTATVTRDVERPLAYKDAIASEYVAGKMYTLGDACYHDGTLYVCAVNRTVYSSWDSSEWVVAEAANPVSVSSIDGKTSVEARNDGTATITTGKELKLPVLLILGGTSFHDHPSGVNNKTWSEDTYIDFNEATVVMQPDMTRYSVSVDGWTYNLIVSEEYGVNVACGPDAQSGSFWSFNVTDYDSHYPRATINPSDAQYFTGDFRLSRQFGAVSKVIATLDDIGGGGVQSVNGDTGPDVHLDATNLYMDPSNDVSIAESVEENSHEIHSESGYNSIGFNTDGDAVIRNVDFNEGAFAHFHNGYQVSYNGITYTAQGDVDIELVGPYYRNIDSAEYYFWVPSSVDDPENFNTFDQSTSPVWYLWTQKVSGEEWAYIPQFMSYANGPQFVVNNWNSENPDTSCIAGTESGEHFNLSRTHITTTLLIANKSEIAYPGTNIPSMDDGSGYIGTSSEYSRSDHVHPSDTKKVSQGDVYSAKILHDGTVELYQDPFYYESETGVDPNGDSITIPLSSRVYMGGVFFSIISSLELASLSPGSSTSANLTIFYYSYDETPGSEPYYGKHILMDAEVSVYSTSATIYQLTLSNINEIGVDANNIAFDQTSAYNYIFSGSAKILDYRSTEGYFLVDLGTLDWISGGSSPNTVISIPEVKTLATEKYVDDAIAGISTGVVSVNGDSGVVVLTAEDIKMGDASNDVTIAEAIAGIDADNIVYDVSNDESVGDALSRLDAEMGDIASVLDAINGESL